YTEERGAGTIWRGFILLPSHAHGRARGEEASHEPRAAVRSAEALRHRRRAAAARAPAHGERRGRAAHRVSRASAFRRAAASADLCGDRRRGEGGAGGLALYAQERI